LVIAGLLFPELKLADVMGMLYVIRLFQTFKINPATATSLIRKARMNFSKKYNQCFYYRKVGEKGI